MQEDEALKKFKEDLKYKQTTALRRMLGGGYKGAYYNAIIREYQKRLDSTE
jgi:hypothetical protein